LDISFNDPNNGNRPGVESLDRVISAAHNAFDRADDDDDDDCDDDDYDCDDDDRDDD
jgi:hypothetical protein